jgi:small subunit ribosomal protein S6
MLEGLMPKYEIVVILDPFLAEADYETETEKVLEQLRKRNAEITATDVWGRRRLAYPIEKKLEGYYLLINFEGNLSGAELADLEQQLRLNERILREMVTRIADPRKPRRKPKKAKVVSESFSAGSAGAAGRGFGN